MFLTVFNTILLLKGRGSHYSTLNPLALRLLTFQSICLFLQQYGRICIYFHLKWIFGNNGLVQEHSNAVVWCQGQMPSGLWHACWRGLSGGTHGTVMIWSESLSNSWKEKWQFQTNLQYVHENQPVDSTIDEILTPFWNLLEICCSIKWVVLQNPI